MNSKLMPVAIDFKNPCAAFTEEIAALISSAPFRNPMENATPYVSMCQRISQSPGAGDHGAFARFEPMSKEAFDGRNCQPPNAENGMEGYTLEKLTGVGESACLYQSKTTSFASIQV